jgi:hypothetical protein
LLLDLTPLHASLRRFTMMLCKFSPAVVGLLANMAMEEGANVMAVMGLLVGASRFATPDSAESVIKACIHVWGLEQARAYIMACMGGLLRAEPWRRSSKPMIEKATFAANLLLGEWRDMGQSFAACSLLKALAAACSGGMDKVLEGTWQQYVFELTSVVVRVSEEGRAEDEAFDRQEQRRALLESLVTSLPAGVTLPTVTSLLADVAGLFTMRVGEGVDEDDVRRCLAARLGVGTQVLKAAKAHIQGRQETMAAPRTCRCTC